MTAYQQYAAMSWTTDSDECEEGCGAVMSENSYVSGTLGHYCSTGCRSRAEASPPSEPRGYERRQMGITD